MVRVSRPHDLQMEDGRGRNGQFRGGMSRVGGAAGLGEPLARELILRGGRLLEPVVTHTAQDRGRLGELDLVVLDDLEPIAPGIEEVEPAAGEDLHAGLLQRRADGGLVVDHQPEVPVLVRRLGTVGRERDELVAEVDEGHPRFDPAPELEREDATVELEGRVYVAHLERDVVEADGASPSRHPDTVSSSLVRDRDDIDAATTDLYRLPRDEFTSARDGLARRLRRENKHTQADEVKALRKPTAAAWLVNQLSHQATADLKKLLSAGERMRKARTATEMRKAALAERDAIAKLLARAERIAGPQSATTSERVRETLHAAAGDVEVGRLVASGRLDKERQLVGFGGAGPLTDDGEGAAEAAKRTGAAGPRAATKRRDEDRRRRREHEAARRKLERAEQAHARAVAEAERAQAELKRAAAELADAKARERDL